MRTPWDALVRRLRFLTQLRQSQLAAQLGVDQTTISRWERGRDTPDIKYQKILRDRLQAAEATLPGRAIEAMPIRALVYSSDNMGHLTCCSRVVAEEHGMAIEDMRYFDISPLWPDSVREMHELLYQADGWRSGEIAMAKCKVFRITGEWYNASVLPLYSARRVLFTAEKCAVPPEISTKHCEITLFNKDDLIL